MPEKDRVAFGFTTYVDIRNSEYGEKLYEALESISRQLTPNRMNFLGVNLKEVDLKSFSQNWYHEYPMERREHRGKGAKVLEKGVLPVGCQWSRTGPLSAKGRLGLCPSLDPLPSYTISMEFNYSPRIDWQGLFLLVVGLLRPSYGMLHLFTEDERIGELFDKFSYFGPVVGEIAFTGWISSLGELRKPDSFEISKRRQYTYLPQLSWMNFLGPEFSGKYDPQAIMNNSCNYQELDFGAMFSITNSIGDVKNKKELFEECRKKLKASFVDGFFRF